jgi:6-phosphogluconolactonase
MASHISSAARIIFPFFALLVAVLTLATKSMAQFSTNANGNQALESGEIFLIGGYGESIFASRLNSDGSMEPPVAAGSLLRPNFFVQHPRANLIYAVGSSVPTESENPGLVTAFQWDWKQLRQLRPDSLVLLNQQPIPFDTACHVSVDPKAEYLVVANYGKGSIVLYPLEANGAIGPMLQRVVHVGSSQHPSRQSSPHAHCSAWTSGGDFLLVADLGLDKVLVYGLDRKKRTLNARNDLDLSLAPGAGPRHITFDPNQKFLYVINELNMTISVFQWNPEGPSKLIQTISTLPEGVSDPGFSTAEILFHPTGKFLYGSNRGHNTIASFTVDILSGKLEATGHVSTLGKTPRNFRLSLNGQFLLAENQQSNDIFSFRINPDSGTLMPTGFRIEAPAPACIKFIK